MSMSVYRGQHKLTETGRFLAICAGSLPLVSGTTNMMKTIAMKTIKAKSKKVNSPPFVCRILKKNAAATRLPRNDPTCNKNKNV